jgi:hypothetical protein
MELITENLFIVSDAPICMKYKRRGEYGKYKDDSDSENPWLSHDKSAKVSRQVSVHVSTKRPV